MQFPASRVHAPNFLNFNGPFACMKDGCKVNGADSFHSHLMHDQDHTQALNKKIAVVPSTSHAYGMATPHSGGDTCLEPGLTNPCIVDTFNPKAWVDN